MSDIGIDLNCSQLKLIQCQLKSDNPCINFDLTETQVAQAKIKSKQELDRAIEILLSKIFSSAPNIAENVADTITLDTAEYVSDIFFRKIRRTYRYSLQNRHNIQARFEENVFYIWGKAINQLKVLLGLAIEVIEHLDKMFHDGKIVYSEIKWTVLNRLHGRACQVTGKIICLLKAGYADGAEARWRSLHELSVVSMFIFDQDNQIADLYIQHDITEEHKEIAFQLSCYPELIKKNDFCLYKLGVETKLNELTEKYGKHFSGDYGWAAPALGGQKPSFRQLEQHVDLSSARYAYRKASHNIHAGVRGTFDRLGLHSECEIILAGASAYGLEKPGICTAASLLQASVTLLQGVELVDAAIFMKVIAKQAEVTRKEFQRAHRRMLKTLAEE